jgi:hypothetical protein
MTRGDASAERGFLRQTLIALAGLMIWLAHFLFVYGLAALACARAWNQAEPMGIGWVKLAIAAATVLGVGALGVLAWRGAIRQPPTPGQGFFRWLSLAAAGAALLAILWQGLPAALLPPC